MKNFFKLFLITMIAVLQLFSCKVVETDYVDKIVEKEVEVEKRDETPPTKIESASISATSGDGAILLSWTNPGDEDFYGTEYTFSLVAIDTNTNKATLSTKKATPVDSQDKTPPATVTELSAQEGNGKIILSWENPADTDFYGVWISEKSNSGTLASPVFIKSPTNMFVTSDLQNGVEYEFSVMALDESLNEGVASKINATPTSTDAGETLKIELSSSIPHENGYTGNKSNTKVTVTANITTASAVKRVVWKKNGTAIAKILLADADATSALENSDDNTKWTFNIVATDENANATYTVAAIDETGREEAEQITIDQFDFTPPAAVQMLTVTYSSSSNKVTLNWSEPSNSDFAGVRISYTYNTNANRYDESESLEKTIDSFNKGTIDTDIPVKTESEADAKIYSFYVKSVDLLGNESAAVKRAVAVVPDVIAGYEFHEIPDILDPGTDGTAGTTATYVYFGDWPQTIKASDVTIEESQYITMGGNTYYLGSDNNYYIKCTENAYDANYTYSDGTNAAYKSANSIKYFKVESIKWRLLSKDSSGKVFLFAENILTANVAYYDYAIVNRTVDNSIVYPNNYKHSKIRAFLNGLSYQVKSSDSIAQTENTNFYGKGFLQTAFTATAQNLIDTTTVDNSVTSTIPKDNPTLWDESNSFACEDTNDKIFLLSIKEATTSAYGFSDWNNSVLSNSHIRVTTDYAKANHAFQITDSGYGGIYWLRSPRRYSNQHAGAVDYRGSISSQPVSGTYEYSGSIVPALWVSTEN